jgi:nucleotide-binding universal stress UspA family protein
MQRIVVAVKAGEQQLWLADAAADVARQTGAALEVVSIDGLELEALSTVPRSELAALAQEAVDAAVARLRENGVEATGEVRPGQVTRGILLFAEEREADVIVCGASGRGPVATRVLGSVPMELVQRSRRPVLIITPPRDGNPS